MIERTSVLLSHPSGSPAFLTVTSVTPDLGTTHQGCWGPTVGLRSTEITLPITTRESAVVNPVTAPTRGHETWDSCLGSRVSVQQAEDRKRTSWDTNQLKWTVNPHAFLANMRGKSVHCECPNTQQRRRIVSGLKTAMGRLVVCRFGNVCFISCLVDVVPTFHSYSNSSLASWNWDRTVNSASRVSPIWCRSFQKSAGTREGENRIKQSVRQTG